MSELISKQHEFSCMVARLILHAAELGYQVTLGEAYRTPEQAAINARAGKGIRRSLHQDRLAIDLHLFHDGKYLATTEDHATLGKWWESIGGSWGGRFKDGNHYSLAHGGRK